MINNILQWKLVWLESLPPAEPVTIITLLSGDGALFAACVPLLPAASPLLQRILADLPPPAYTPCFISLPSTVGAVLLAVRDIVTLSYLYCTKQPLMIFTLYKVIKWPPNICNSTQRAWKNLPLAGRKNIQEAEREVTRSVHIWGRLDQLRGWPPGWFSWISELNDVK